MPSAYRKKILPERALDEKASALSEPGQEMTALVGCPCSKIRHEQEEDAKRAARDGMLAGAPPLNVYGCLLCDGWHLTSAPERKAPKKRRAR
jgi:hypothetical protein